MTAVAFTVPYDPALSVEDNTDARGDICSVTFNSASPKLREWLPDLPFVDAADKMSCSLPHAIVAFLIWPALWCSDPLVMTAKVLTHIIHMDKAAMVLDKLDSLGFTPSGGVGLSLRVDTRCDCEPRSHEQLQSGHPIHGGLLCNHAE